MVLLGTSRLAFFRRGGTLLCAWLSIQCALGRPRWHELEGYSFEQYVRDFGKGYVSGTEEYTFREQLFTQELHRVQELNAAGLTWKEGVNHRSDMTGEEMRADLGLLRQSPNHMARQQPRRHQRPAPARESLGSSAHSLPSAVDWREKGVVGPVQMQGRCGACYAFSTTAVLTSYAAITSGVLPILSQQQLTSCQENPDGCGGAGGCDGGTNAASFEYIMDAGGIYNMDQMPYIDSFAANASACTIPPACPYPLCNPQLTIDGYSILEENDYDSVMYTLATVGPLGVNVDASTWSAYETGIYAGCNQTVSDVDHVVMSLGYGEENGVGYWIIQNSWGVTWGEAGYMRLLREDNPLDCATDPWPVDGYVCETDDTGPITVCGQCGILGQSAFPLGVEIFDNYSYFPAEVHAKNHKSDSDKVNTKGLTAGLIVLLIITALLGGFIIYILRTYDLHRKSAGNVVVSRGDEYSAMAMNQGLVSPNSRM